MNSEQEKLKSKFSFTETDGEESSCCSDCNDENCKEKKEDVELQDPVECLETLLKDKTEEIQKLKQKIALLEGEKEKFVKDQNAKFFELIEKKSNEAAEILEQKRLELIKKYQDEFELKKDFLYEDQLTDLIGIVVQFEKIINYPVTSDEVRNYLNGFQMFLHQFKQILADFNVHEVVPNKGDEFDSAFMTVVKTTDDAKCEKNKVVEVFSNAYQCKGRFLRLAEVMVCV